MKRIVKLVIYAFVIILLIALSIGLSLLLNSNLALYLGITASLITAHFFHVYLFSKEINEKKAYNLLLQSINEHENQKTENALAIVNDAIILAPQADELYFHRAIFRESVRNYKGAIEDFSKCIELNDRNGVVYYMRGTLLYLHDYNDEAFRDMNRALDLHFEKSVVYTIRGWIHLERNELRSAVSDFNKAIEKDPEDPENYFGLGLSYERAESYEPAVNNLETAIRKDPENPKLWVAKARCYFKWYAYDEALETLNTAVGKGINDSALLYSLGYVNYSLNGFDIALENFRNVLLVSPDYVDALYFSSVCMTETGQWSDALHQLNHTIEIAPTLSRAYILRAYIKNLLGDTSGSEEDLEKGRTLENSI